MTLDVDTMRRRLAAGHCPKCDRPMVDVPLIGRRCGHLDCRVGAGSVYVAMAEEGMLDGDWLRDGPERVGTQPGT